MREAHFKTASSSSLPLSVQDWSWSLWSQTRFFFLHSATFFLLSNNFFFFLSFWFLQVGLSQLQSVSAWIKTALSNLLFFDRSKTALLSMAHLFLYLILHVLLSPTPFVYHFVSLSVVMNLITSTTGMISTAGMYCMFYIKLRVLVKNQPTLR